MKNFKKLLISLLLVVMQTTLFAVVGLSEEQILKEIEGLTQGMDETSKQLVKALNLHDNTTIKTLIENGKIDINNRDVLFNPLANSVMDKNFEMVGYLLKRGANPNLLLEPWNMSILQFMESHWSGLSSYHNEQDAKEMINFIKNYRGSKHDVSKSTNE